MRCARSATASALLGRLALVAACSLVAGLSGCEVAPAAQQPMDFSHKRHTEAEIDCLTCHEKAGDQYLATAPKLRACMKCHKEQQGKDPEEAKVREFAAKKQEIPWVRVNWMPGHVHFSHQAHVGFAEMECDVCHGAMKQQEHALTRSNTSQLTMRACIKCHADKGVTSDCVTCHK